ncbi:MAG: hypothetical protein OCD01_05950 [Fibrobacterales bacterium]
MHLFKILLLAAVTLITSCVFESEKACAPANGYQCMTEKEQKIVDDIDLENYDRGTFVEHDELEFTFEIDWDWDCDGEEELNGVYSPLFCLGEGRDNDDFTENIVVVITTHNGTYDMDDILSEYKKGVTRMASGVDITDSEVTEIDDTDVAMIEYTATIQNMDLKFREYLFIRDDFDIQIVLSDTEKRFDSREAFEMVRNSLRFDYSYK